MAHGERLHGHVKESCTTTPLSTLGVHVRRAGSIFSKALNFCRSAIAPVPLAGIADISGQPLSPRSRRQPALMASYPHPLQVRAGRNQLQPLLVTMPHGELLHAWRWNSTSGAAPHAVRAWRCALLHLQVRELSDEASIFAVLRLKPLNLFLTLLPVHSFSLGDWFNPGVHT
jgi:hypothetical protein